ncbi:MAG: hypothetical protein H6R17_4020 [Proteobacteria bacterium]|nr:hypothetical protein [Pseudomonadota bacterium]
MDNGEKTGKDALGNCIDKLNALTKQRDELLRATKLLLAVIDRQAPSLEGMMELEDIRAVVAKARGEDGVELSGKMVEIPIEKFYKFDHSIHQGKYSVHVDSEAKYGFFEDDELGDEHGGSLWFATDAQGKLALTSYDGLAVLPTGVVRALESQGFVVADKFK